MGALADWLIALPDAETMRAIDRWAIDERGVAGLDLMERAGAGVARAVEQMAQDGPVSVFCGKGNNGGDGLVAARLLREAGRDVTVICISPAGEFQGDALRNLDRLSGPPPVSLAEARPDSRGVIVDALLGTGFEGSARGAAAEAIERINASGAPVVSVDVPSGVDASTGVVRGQAVRAHLTVTFHAAKPGLWIRPGKEHAGRVKVIDIGVPRGAPLAPVAGAGVGRGIDSDGSPEPPRAPIGLISGSVLSLLPRRGAGSTKFTSGHVLVVGGSRDLSGAPRMAAEAAMRAGAGYVTACVPSSLQGVLQSLGPPEMMVRGVAERDGSLTPEGVAGLLAESDRGGAVALGPGLGRGDHAFAFARELTLHVELPLVLDADGLNAHAGRLDELAARHHPTVITPHAGELGRLLEVESAEVERDRLSHVLAAARQSGAVAVLKGDDTLVAHPDGRVAVSPGGSPALATAGSGDVLTGIIAALLSEGLEAFTAAAAAVMLHVIAGRRAAACQGSAEGVVASDVIAALPGARDPSAAAVALGERGVILERRADGSL